MDITKVAQGLLNELKEETLVNKGMQEGVILLHDRIKKGLDEEKAAAEKAKKEESAPSGTETKQ